MENEEKLITLRCHEDLEFNYPKHFKIFRADKKHDRILSAMFDVSDRILSSFDVEYLNDKFFIGKYDNTESIVNTNCEFLDDNNKEFQIRFVFSKNGASTLIMTKSNPSIDMEDILPHRGTNPIEIILEPVGSEPKVKLEFFEIRDFDTMICECLQYNPQTVENPEDGLSLIDRINSYESTRATPIMSEMFAMQRIVIVITSEYNMEFVKEMLEKEYSDKISITQIKPKAESK
jgi:hypothetical protein